MNENENLQPVEKLTPFTRMVMSIGTLPSSFYASMSYYESMVWLYEYLKNQIIPTVNNNAEAVEELQQLFIQLKEWTETYTEETIPAEISRQLDEMVEDGTITNLIMEYMNENAQLTFNTVQEMKTKQNITEGAFLKTYGFYSYNDGGGALYKVRAKTNDENVDEKFIISLNNQLLIAELVYNELNIKQIGAYGDDNHDDTQVINYAIEYLRDHSKNILYIPKGTYKTTSPIILYDYIELIGESTENSIIHKTTNTTETIFNTDSIIVFNKNSLSTYNYSNGQEIKNLTLKGNGSNTYGIYANIPAPYSKLNNLKISNLATCICYLNGGWLFEISDLHLNGSLNGMQILHEGTSLYLKNIYIISGSNYGYDIHGINYSSFNNLCCDFINGTPYNFEFCNISINGLGCECENTETSIRIINSNIIVNNAFIIGNPSSSDYRCIAINDSSAIFNNLKVHTSNDNFAGQFLADGSNVRITFNDLNIDKPFLTANRNYNYNTIIINDINGSNILRQKNKFSGIGNLSNTEINNNGNFNYKQGGIFFNNFGSVATAYDHDRAWEVAGKYGDLFINQAPLKNGVFAFQQATDTIDHNFTGTITATNISGSGGTITLDELTLDADATIKGITPIPGYHITSSSGGNAIIQSVNFQANRMALNTITGTFNVNDTLQLKGRNNVRDQIFNGIQYINTGTTEQRPTSPATGLMYYDTTLNKPIWYINSEWKDSTGTTV